MIIDYSVKLDEKDKTRFLTALDRVWKSSNDQIQTEMPKRGAIRFLTLLKSNVISQRYGSTYKPLNKQYDEWKGTVGKFWFLKGDFLRTLSVFVYNPWGKIGWMAGVPQGAKDSGGKSWFYPRDSEKQNKYGPRSIPTYAYYGEFGHKGKHPQPPRPIFFPTLVDYKRDEWPKQGDETLKYIGRQWR